MKNIWTPVAIAIKIIYEENKKDDLTVLPLVMSALQKGVEIAWENPCVAEQILRLNECDIANKILALLSCPTVDD